jgi:superfamily II DNA or RNA helicase
VVVVDEAHHATLGSDRHEAVQALCRKAPYVVLLTATPHNGDPQAFASLCSLGQHDDAVMVFRRSRKQLGHPRERRIHQLRVRAGPEERRMHAALDAFVRAVHREPGGRESSTWLALATLRKRALSSALALLRSVERRVDVLAATGDDPLRQLTLPLFDGAGEFDAADDVPAWTIPSLRDPHHERELLSRVAHTAGLAIGRESKLAALTRLLRRIGEPAIVFTEYRDTLVHVRDGLAPNATLLHGALSRDERRSAVARFIQGGVLLATDAAGEGLNLHHNCRIVVNLELPWNPMRLEQRIGRVDRIGQKRRVHVFHLIAGGTAEMRVLQRLGDRVARAQADVGAGNPLSDDESSEASFDASTVRMVEQAQDEYERLTLARRLAPEAQTHTLGSCDVERHALVTFSKRWELRARLGSQVLLIFRSVLSDEGGQPVACHLTPVQLGFRRDTPWSLTQLETFARGAVADDSARNTWFTSSVALQSAFWRTRLARERAIAGTHTPAAFDELQPGLFDLRAEQAWAAEQERRLTALRESAWFSTAALKAATLLTDSAHLVLVLLPFK